MESEATPQVIHVNMFVFVFIFIFVVVFFFLLLHTKLQYSYLHKLYAKQYYCCIHERYLFDTNCWLIAKHYYIL